MSIINETAKIDDLSGGLFSAEIGITPNFYFKDNVWRPITNELITSGDPNLPIGLDELFTFKINNKIEQGKHLVFLKKNDEELYYTPLDTNEVNGIINGNEILFPQAWNNADLKIIIAGHIFKKDIILYENHPPMFRFKIEDKVGLDDDLIGNEFFIREPYLYKEDFEEIIHLSWIKEIINNELIYKVVLPEGDWGGWILDPTYTSQPGNATGLDTYIDYYAPNTNFGAVDFIEIKWHNVPGYTTSYSSVIPGYWGRTSSLIKFDLSSIASGSIINSANITFWVREGAAVSGKYIYMYPSLRNWSESTATWNVFSTGNNWGTAGSENSTSDYYNTAISSLVGQGSTNIYALNPSILQEMIPGGSITNNGFFMKRSFESTQNDTYKYRSSEYIVSTERPKLTVVYTEPAGAVTTFPKSSPFGKRRRDNS